jgi:glycine betaine/choline ABC-type transport system substrate-binding protein
MRRLAVALVALMVAGCGAPPGPPVVTIGATSDPESVLLAHLYGAALRTYGTATQVITSDDPLGALDTGDARVVPGFTGRLLTRFEPNATARAAEQVYRELLAALPEGVAAGDYAMSAQDEPAAAVTEATAASWGDRLSGLASRCAEVRPGATVGARPPAAVGTCRPAKAREFADDAALWAALRAGRVNAAWTTTAAPAIPSDVVVLADKSALIRAENVVPLYRRNELDESQVLALNELAGVLDTAGLAEMRASVADGADPAQVADGWLAAHPLRD